MLQITCEKLSIKSVKEIEKYTRQNNPIIQDVKKNKILYETQL